MAEKCNKEEDYYETGCIKSTWRLVMIFNGINEVYPIMYQIKRAWHYGRTEHNTEIMKQDISSLQRKLMSEF
jgi:hypothetical protein